ncbi:MAG: nucleotidyltransferase [Clostridia bacterium]|nr:nucleotidyltransferase [Clostridia bacterium]
MKTAGIIVEYNPLHNGHAWQLQKVKETLGKDTAIVVVMSGPFTQRGEPAVLDKWTRASMALACGASLVLELPLPYATASAERFASGGVQILAATGITKTLVFGSEHGMLPDLLDLANLLSSETPAFKASLQGYLETGLSFAAARQLAVAALLGDSQKAALLKSSNNILGVEYLKAILRLPARKRLDPVTFQRQGQGYLDPSPASDFASATAIRQVIASGRYNPALLLQQLAHTMPPEALGILLAAVARKEGVVLYEDLAVPVLTHLRTRKSEDLLPYPGMGEGLAQRLHEFARRPAEQDSRDARLRQLVESAMSRRLPRTRVQRALLHMLLNLKTSDLEQIDAAGGPAYIRVLGFDKNGRYLLKLMRQKASLPVITRGSDFHEHLKDPNLQHQSQFDLAGTDLWSILAGSNAGTDFDRPVVIR